MHTTTKGTNIVAQLYCDHHTQKVQNLDTLRQKNHCVHGDFPFVTLLASKFQLNGKFFEERNDSCV